jgi:AcrR family transcriptional regulator
MPPTSATATTRQRLLEATEALLAERAEREITVRDITMRAGANVASVGYHYGSRDELVIAALGQVIRRVTEERREELEGLPEDADLETVVRAWLAPALVALSADDGGAADWRILARTFLSGSPLLTGLVNESRPDVERTLIRRLSGLLPHLDPAELAWRHAATLGVAGFLGAGGGALLSAHERVRAADRFVAYVVGALQAPPSDPPPSP